MKTTHRKLSLNKSTLRNLSARALAAVRGADGETTTEDPSDGGGGGDPTLTYGSCMVTMCCPDTQRPNTGSGFVGCR